MGVVYKAVLPNKKASYAKLSEDGINKLLKNFMALALKDLQTYPMAQPWKSQPPRTGLRAGGRRTGSYGKGWTGEYDLKSGESITVTNRVPYAVYVGGPSSGAKGARQTAVMKARGWPNVSTVGKNAAKQAIKDFKL